MGDDQVFFLRRGGQGAQRPEERGTGQRQRRDPRELRRACAVAWAALATGA
jgi:hypothetical protein